MAQTPSLWTLGLICFSNMASVGSVYALSILQTELPRLISVSSPLSFFPFAAACCGLSCGVASCAVVIQRLGPHPVMALGTTLWGLAVISAGYSLIRGSFLAILACFLVGGIGVGWTYLAVVVAVGQGFQHQPLARSAIGPLGFSFGTASCLLLSSYLTFGILNESRIGLLLCRGGASFVAVGSATFLVLPMDCPQDPTVTSRNDQKRPSPENSWGALLFCNAFPGMAAFAALLPLASRQLETASIDPHHALASALIALGGGGVLAPALHERLAPNVIFSSLLLIRGCLLLAAFRFGTTALSLLSFGAVFFGHGAGFSILPAIVKRHNPEGFVPTYGRVLVVWGFAGVAGSLKGAIVSWLGEDSKILLLILGTISLAACPVVSFLSI